MKDESQQLPYDVDKAALLDLANGLTASIRIDGDTIIVEGNEADVDEACSQIALLPKRKTGNYGKKYEDPFADLEEGQRYTDRTEYMPDDYTVYDLISFDEDKGQWLCDVTTYYFRQDPYRFEYAEHATMYVKPDSLLRLRKVKRKR